MLARVTGWSVSKDAAIKGNAAFFAPLIGIFPLSGLPPLITNLPIKVSNFRAEWSDQDQALICFT